MRYFKVLKKIKLLNLIYFLLIISTVILISSAKSQDFLNPCYFCHMDVIVEMKTYAATHWESDVGCEVCHGPSREHIDVEDNSIKPDRIWTEKNVHELCNECHQEALKEFKKSVHSTTVIDVKDSSTIKADPVNCSTCHGYHQQKTIGDIRKKCIHCHNSLPEVCLKSSKNDNNSIEEVNCQNCHSTHSLAIIKEEQ